MCEALCAATLSSAQRKQECRVSDRMGSVIRNIITTQAAEVAQSDTATPAVAPASPTLPCWAGGALLAPGEVPVALCSLQAPAALPVCCAKPNPLLPASLVSQNSNITFAS